jgi:hypothetical protein
MIKIGPRLWGPFDVALSEVDPEAMPGPAPPAAPQAPHAAVEYGFAYDRVLGLIEEYFKPLRKCTVTFAKSRFRHHQKTIRAMLQ